MASCICATVLSFALFSFAFLCKAEEGKWKEVEGNHMSWDTQRQNVDSEVFFIILWGPKVSVLRKSG